MADIRCPNCGKSNPDVLDVCQFCQTPLQPDSVLRIGEKPTKKNTGELEPILPDWLRDVRQQARSAAEEESQAESQTPSNEPADFLAGLASQAGSSDDEDVPDWLASLTPSVKKPSAAETTRDILGQSNETKSEPTQETPEDDTPSWMAGMRDQAPPPAEKDELSGWFSNASDQPQDIASPTSDRNDEGWASPFDFQADADVPAPREEEDLSWLRNLEAASKQTGELDTAKPGLDWSTDFEKPSTASEPDASPNDLSWLDRLGGIEEPFQPEPEKPAPTPSQGDLSWLDQFGGSTEPPRTETPAAPPAASSQDLSWLNDLGTPSEPQPVDAAPNQPIPTDPFAPAEDLDWLNKLGGSEPVQPVPSAEDLSWLNDLGGKPEELAVPPFNDLDAGMETPKPRQTAPLNKDALKDREAEPEWLRRATEAPSMPAPGDLSTEWFTTPSQPPQEKAPSSALTSSPFDADAFATPGEPASLSNDDVDSLFSVEMPDWLSRADPETQAPVSSQPGTMPTESDDPLAPVDLPSWVQAMRPVEAVITETASSVADQPAETEGPLAGLHGVIPIAPIGSAKRPKPVSLTLQAPPEQQASAVLLEQILGSETSPRALVTASVVVSQHWLRWLVSGLFLLVLSAVIFLRSQLMPVVANPAALPGEFSTLSNAVLSIPANSKILVVIDYEPSLAAEMEAVGGSLLSQVIRSSQPNISFVSTSLNGMVLAERLMDNQNIAQSSVPYLNLGYLPGGSAGVLGFIQNPGQIVPSAGVSSFSEYSALVVLTDHAESGRVWVEQLQTLKQVDPSLINQPLLMAVSAQAGPMLQPYVSSRQITGMISGLSDAARYELNNNRSDLARPYWDTFGVGLMMSIALIIIGSLWSLFTGMRARRASAEQG